METFIRTQFYDPSVVFTLFLGNQDLGKRNNSFIYNY